ncbi:MAG TPA: hypothetical protein VLL97_10255, partial [Acidobacteriota bacterium]|nr:hypothetical protein [Acidobacteriota bacterium]
LAMHRAVTFVRRRFLKPSPNPPAGDAVVPITLTRSAPHIFDFAGYYLKISDPVTETSNQTLPETT